MSAQTEWPTLTVFVGPNGAGKSTLYRKLIHRKPSLSARAYVNADDLTHSLGGSHVAGGRAAIELRRSLLAQKQSFIWETTGSGKNELRFIQQAKSAGYRIDIRFVGVESPKRSFDRVRVRVQTGGHPVPKIDIYRRYDRVMAKFNEYRLLADEFRAYDNSARQHRLFVLDKERTLVREQGMPAWLQSLLSGEK